MTTQTNNFTDGYDVRVSANFGSEEVVLKGESIEIRLSMKIKQAEIYLETHHCSPLMSGDSRKLNETRKVAIKTEQSSNSNVASDKKKNRTSGGGFEGHLGMKDGARLNAKAKSSSELLRAETAAEISSVADQKSTNSEYNFTFISNERIKIGDSRNGLFLQGAEVDNFYAWDISYGPENDKSASVAQLRVRESWIEFFDVREIRTLKKDSATKAISERVLTLVNSKTSKDKKKREFFFILLQHLVFKRLQSSSEKQYATLAADGVFISSEDGEMSPYSFKLDEDTTVLNLTDNVITKFLNANDETAEKIACNPEKFINNRAPINYEFPNSTPTRFFKYIGLELDVVKKATSDILDEAPANQDIYDDVQYFGLNGSTHYDNFSLNEAGSDVLAKVHRKLKGNKILVAHQIDRKVFLTKNKHKKQLIKSIQNKYYTELGSDLQLSDRKRKAVIAFEWLELLNMLDHIYLG